MGTDRKRAEHEAALLQHQLAEGTYTNLRRATWGEFVAEHVGMIPGAANRVEAKRTLDEFGAMFPVSPKAVTYRLVESYVEKLRAKGNSVATVNKKLRYLRGAFNKAVQRCYVAKNPMAGWQWVKENRKRPRILTDDEETAILEASKALFGFRVRAFVFTALNVGARRSELISLTWDRVDFDRAEVLFTNTKGKRDRTVPLNLDVADILRRLHLQTALKGGPFIGLADNLGRMWARIIRKAGVSGVSIHDLRRTFCTRLLRSGAPPTTVQRLLGHADIKTTLDYYSWVSDDDLRAGVAKLRQVTAG